MVTINCAKCGKALTPGQAGDACPDCGSMDRNLTAEERAVLTEKLIVAKDLARKHFEIEPGMTQIFTIWDAPAYEALRSTPIKLLEVNANNFPSGVLPLGFDPVPSAGIPYPSVIVEVTPDEFSRIQSQDLKLPAGWTVGESLPKPSLGGDQ